MAMSAGLVFAMVVVGFAVVSTQHAQPAAWLSGRLDGEPEDDVTRQCLARQKQHHDTASTVSTLAQRGMSTRCST